MARSPIFVTPDSGPIPPVSLDWPGASWTRTNPLARRNHHLVKGEKVKWSRKGKGGSHAMTKSSDRGVVTLVRDDGYLVKWTKGALKGSSTFVPDQGLVSARSTSRSWPGNHYEGIDPKARKNPSQGRPMTYEELQAMAKRVANASNIGGFLRFTPAMDREDAISALVVAVLEASGGNFKDVSEQEALQVMKKEKRKLVRQQKSVPPLLPGHLHPIASTLDEEALTHAMGMDYRAGKRQAKRDFERSTGPGSEPMTKAELERHGKKVAYISGYLDQIREEEKEEKEWARKNPSGLPGWKRRLGQMGYAEGLEQAERDFERSMDPDFEVKTKVELEQGPFSPEYIRGYLDQIREEEEEWDRNPPTTEDDLYEPDDWLDNPRPRSYRKREKGREKRQIRGAPKASWFLMLEGGGLSGDTLVEGFGSREEALRRSLEYAKAFSALGKEKGHGGNIPRHAQEIPFPVYRHYMRDSIFPGPYSTLTKWKHGKEQKQRWLKAGETAQTGDLAQTVGGMGDDTFPTGEGMPDADELYAFYPRQAVFEWEYKQRNKKKQRRNPRLTVGQRVKYSDEAINALLERQKWHSGMKAYGAGTVAQRKKRYIQEHRDRRGIITKANPNMTAYIVKWESNPSGDPRDESMLNVPGHYLVAANSRKKKQRRNTMARNNPDKWARMAAERKQRLAVQRGGKKYTGYGGTRDGRSGWPEDICGMFLRTAGKEDAQYVYPEGSVLYLTFHKNTGSRFASKMRWAFTYGTHRQGDAQRFGYAGTKKEIIAKAKRICGGGSGHEQEPSGGFGGGRRVHLSGASIDQLMRYADDSWSSLEGPARKELEKRGYTSGGTYGWTKKARNNMGFKLTDSEGRVHEADTFEEYLQMKKDMGGGKKKRSRAASKPRGRGRREFTPPKNPNAVVSRKQAFSLVKYLKPQVESDTPWRDAIDAMIAHGMTQQQWYDSMQLARNKQKIPAMKRKLEEWARG